MDHTNVVGAGAGVGSGAHSRSTPGGEIATSVEVKQVVIVATYLPTGEFQANAVIRHDTAVNAALAAYYSQQQAKARNAARAQREADEAAEKLAKKASKSMGKEAVMEAQKARTAAESAEKQRLAASTASFNTVFA